MKYLIGVVHAELTCYQNETKFVTTCSISALVQPLELLLNFKNDTTPHFTHRFLVYCLYCSRIMIFFMPQQHKLSNNVTVGL